MKITQKTTIAEMASIVSETLRRNNIDAFLSGGAVVTIYSENEYESWDLDFVSHADRKAIKAAMESIGFVKEKNRYYIHPKSKIYVEFPGTAFMIGDTPINEFNEIKSNAGVLKLLTPTYCVMDRLSAFYFWDDLSSLDQAVAVYKKQKVNLSKVKQWSKREGMIEKYDEFMKKIKLG